MKKRAVESLENFKARIAAIIGDKSEHIAGALVRGPVRPTAGPDGAGTRQTVA